MDRREVRNSAVFGGIRERIARFFFKAPARSDGGVLHQRTAQTRRKHRVEVFPIERIHPRVMLQVNTTTACRERVRASFV